MLKNTHIVPFVMCLVVACGCATTPRTDEIADTLTPVMDRYDAYAGVYLSGPELREAREDVSLVRYMYEANRGGTLPPLFGQYLGPVLDKHDTWVRLDNTLGPVPRRVYLNSTAALRLLFDID